MPKIHPNAAAPETDSARDEDCVPLPPPEEAAVLTVWRKSLLFNCDGFTVFDAKGNLVFRVDCYGSGSRGEVVLMDAAGKPLLTLRRKKLSWADHWVIYDGDGMDAKPLVSVRRHLTLRSSKSLAHVTPLPGLAGACEGYVVEGSYGRRSCAVLDAARRRAVAEVRRKEEPVGADVFRLVASPELGAPLAMGLVIALDEMFGGCWTPAVLTRSWSS